MVRKEKIKLGKWKSHNIPANRKGIVEQLGVQGYSHLPKEAWHCENCGLHCSKTLDKGCTFVLERYLTKRTVSFEIFSKRFELVMEW